MNKFMIIFTVNDMAREKHLGETVMYGSLCVSFLNGKPLVKNTVFKSVPKKRRSGESQKSRFRCDPKYPPRVWILWSHHPFWISPKKQ